ncbi:MAG: hypothetical protein HUJ61_07840 [Bacilli bacterium]|nr:hypothetical protein [Bacilli bacterium]
MNNDDLSIRFSNAAYATKDEVAKELNLNSVDDIWNHIISYRSSFNKKLSLRNINGTPLSVTMTPSIVEEINRIERKYLKCILQLNRLDPSDDVVVNLKIDQYKKCLNHIADKYNINVTDDFLNSLIKGELSTISPNEMVLANYYRSLKYIELTYINPINHDFLFNQYSLLTGIQLDDNPYRKENTKGNIEFEAIIPLMENMFNFNIHDDVSPLIKAIGSYYQILYCKPFDVYSEEIAILFAKYVMSHNDFESIGSLLNFESILFENKEEVDLILNEVNKTNDLTYLVSYFIKIFEKIIVDILDKITISSVSSIKEEYYQEERKTPRSIVRDSGSILINSQDYQNLSNNGSHQVNFERNVALPTLPLGLDESDANKIENHLIEAYPTLKKGQAFFYARHCTIGKYYTISQYKKLMNVAYETARTSMDNLVDLGFYRKEKLNNKFIYTPIARK